MPVLRAAALVAGQQHRRALREQKRRQEITRLLGPQRDDRGIVAGTFDAAVPAQIRVASVAVVFAVGLVVFAVVTDQVAQREAVVGRDEVERGARMPPVVREDVARARQARSQLGPTCRARRARSDARRRESGRSTPTSPAGNGRADSRPSRVPRLGDQLDRADDRVLRDRSRNALRESKPSCRRDSAGAKSKRKPSTCISSTQ